MEVEGPSLPSNYVTIHHLKERWLLKHHQNLHLQLPNSNNHDDQGDSQLNPRPNNQAALQRARRRNRSSPRPNHRPTINKRQPQIAVHDSDSKTEVAVDDNHPKAEKEEHKTDHSNSEPAKREKGPRALKPRSVTDQNPNRGGTTPLEPEPVEQKRHVRHIGQRRSRNQKVVWEAKDKTAPLAQKLDSLSLKDTHGDGVVEAVAAAAVKVSNVPNVSKGTSRREASGKFHRKPIPKQPWKPLYWAKEGQTSLVWVKKGGSAAN